jgi:hypothetical protein
MLHEDFVSVHHDVVESDADAMRMPALEEKIDRLIKNLTDSESRFIICDVGNGAA